MAITINGSGTIGGVSVGGLPDGIVDTDMLASNAVTTAKITDGNITTAKILDGNVTSAKVGSLDSSNLPSGTILRAYYASFNSGTVVSTTTQTDIGLNFSNVVINSGETPLFFATISARRLNANQGHVSISLRYTGSATGRVADNTWGWGIMQQSDNWSWVMYNISGVNLKQARGNAFNSTGTFNFYVQGNTVNSVQFGGEQNSPTAGYGATQATILIVKD